MKLHFIGVAATMLVFASSPAIAQSDNVAASTDDAPRSPDNRFNPTVSANLLMLGGYATREEEHGDDEPEADPHGHDHGRGDLESGLHLQEVELQFSAVADPYFRADLTLAAHEGEIGFEEAFVSTTSVPSVTIRAGQMFAAFGRHNRLHTHTFPFLTAPLPARQVLGADGLRGMGASVEVLLPLPFYAEVIGQVFDAEWDLIGEAEQLDLRYLGHLTTLFDLGVPTTLELGGSYVGGPNGEDEVAHLVGGDITLKWRPSGAAIYRGLEWASEVIWADEGHETDLGFWSGLRAQVARRWWVQGRGAATGLTDHVTPRAEALVGWVPSEFSTLRLQYGVELPDDDDPIHEVMLQAIVSIGSHPAHSY